MSALVTKINEGSGEIWITLEPSPLIKAQYQLPPLVCKTIVTLQGKPLVKSNQVNFIANFMSN